MSATAKKVMVITGAAGGIGRACAKAMKDYTLVMTDYSQELVNEVTEELVGLGYDAVGHACDITKKEEVERLREFALAQGHYSGLIHTAGVSGSGQDPKKVFTIDLVGTDIITNTFYGAATEGSALILFASIMGHTVPANPDYDEALRKPQQKNSFEKVAGFVNGDADMMYNFARRGVHLLCKDNAMRFGEKGARIVSLSPGVIMTPMAIKAAEEYPERMQQMKEMTPLGRNGTPEDIAQVVKFLVGKGAGFITGSDILVDGGIVTQLTK